MSAHNFDELRRHVGHEIKAVEHSNEYFLVNVTVECIDCGEVLLDYENPVVTKISASWLRTVFTTDGINSFTGYYDTKRHFTGWSEPAFEKDELMRWLDIEIPGQYTYIEKIDVFLVDQKGFDLEQQYIVGIDVETRDGPKHLYGPDGWHWTIAESNDDFCFCGHSRGAHLSNDGGCSESGCNCQQFLESDE